MPEKVLPSKRTAKTSMRKRKRACPHSEAQDGVCGCPEFWEIVQPSSKPQSMCPSAARDTLATSTSTTDHNTFKSPSPSPPGPPKETCFFWYHGQCRRESCHFAHETHITWPIVPPPGFIHFEPCNLPLCPLRKDLVATDYAKLMEKKRVGLGGQLDGAAFGRTATDEVLSDDGNSFDTDADDGENEKTTDTSFLAAEIAHSDSSSDLESENMNEQGTDEEVAAKATNSSENHDLETSNTSRLTSIALSSTYPDFLNMTDLASIPPFSEAGDEQLAQSINHSGTLGKRQHLLEVQDHVNDNKRINREPIPDLGGFAAYKQRTAHWDSKLLPKYIPDPMLHAADPTHDLPTKPGPLSKAPLAHVWPPKNPSADPSLPFNLPRGQYAQYQHKLVCFYWYHKGYCKPKQRVGQEIRCGYLHTLDTPSPVVSQPPHIVDHQNCSLPLCPIAVSNQANQQPGSNSIYETSLEPHIEHEPRTPVKLEHTSSDYHYSSSPREIIASGRSLAGGKALWKLPKLTGSSKKRFKQQKQRIEQWQEEQRIKPETSNERLERKKAARKEMRRQRRQKRRERRMAHAEATLASIQQQCGSLDLSQPVFRAMPTSSQIHPTPGDLTAVPAKRLEEPKDLPQAVLLQRIFDENSRNWQQPLITRGKRFGETPTLFPMMTRTTNVSQQQARHEEGRQGLKHSMEMGLGGRGHGDDVYRTHQREENRQETAKPSVLVDYSLPEGEARLDWDTDLVRRLFGEIQ